MKEYNGDKEKKSDISDLIKDNGGMALTASKWDGNEDLANIIEGMAEHSKLAEESKKYINTYISEVVKNNLIKNDTDIEVIINETHVIIIPPEKIAKLKESKNIWTLKDINFNNLKIIVIYSENFKSYFVIMPYI